ncbi:uncharacterized protein [Miscanthus floridulus]|uniref:uncharacterized protein n=1 Tax=Miscanthus floridulus TaxID=154761 RepID=UPI0034598C61
MYPLMVDPIVDTKRLTKVLMDGGSGLNIMYAETIDAMGIDRARLRPTRVPFHGIVPGKQAILIRQIDLPITFGNLSNYRTETLTFEFMAIPNCTYLKLKMLGPCGVIIIGNSFQRAYKCEVKSYELALVTLASEELTSIGKDIAEGAPDTKRAAGSFEPTKNIKEVLVDPDNSANKMVRISTALSPK